MMADIQGGSFYVSQLYDALDMAISQLVLGDRYER
jgi:hypothetical protein